MTDYNDTPVKILLYPAIFFLAIGLFIGVFISYNGFIFPDYYAGEYIHFGRIRPVHVAHVTLLWLLSANLGLIYFFVPRLCGINLWSLKLAYISAFLWWFSLIVGVYSFPFGTNYGWEYTELPMLLGGFIPIKLIFAISWVMVAINIFMTIANRKFEKMYVSLWYVMGAMLWTTFTFCLGNFGLELLPGGISRVNGNFFFVHNLVGLIFTPLGVSAAYYFIPKSANVPLYSHKLSMIGFWSIAFFYAWVGAHHLIHGPIAQWLQTVSIVFSIWLFIPVWTVVVNFFYTLRDHWKEYSQSAGIRFLMIGNLFYFFTSLQGSLQALRNVNELSSKTDWIIGHAHMALFGTFTFFAIGCVYYVIPAITKKPLWSKKLADLHFTLTFSGAIIMFLSLFVGGYFQGFKWSTWADGTSYAEFHHQLTQLPFLQTVAEMNIWWNLRGISGILIFIGSLVFAFNLFNTIILKPSDENANIEQQS